VLEKKGRDTAVRRGREGEKKKNGVSGSPQFLPYTTDRKGGEKEREKERGLNLI